MSSAFPSLKVEYSSTGSSWTDASADSSTATLTLRELVGGTSTAVIDLANTGGKYVSTAFPPFDIEQGLWYFWRVTINGKGPWYGRATTLDLDLDKSKETLQVQLGLMDEPLKNFYLTGVINNDTLDTMMSTAFLKFLALKNLYLPIIVSGYEPPLFGRNYDCSRTRIYVYDFVRDLLTSVNDTANSGYGWTAYVDSTVGATSGTFNLFPQGNKTYASSLTYASNVSVVKFTRDILRTKNWIEFVGGMGNTEPSGGDAWTENSTYGWVGNGYYINTIVGGSSPTVSTIQTSTTHYCPTTGQQATSGQPCGVTDGCPDDCRSIQSIGNPPAADLRINTVLGENFNLQKRNATTLNFAYKITYPAGDGAVYLADSSRHIIVWRGNSLTANTRNVNPNTWHTLSVPIGPTAIGGVLSWNTFSGMPPFDWSNITDVIFAASKSGSSTGANLFIDHLYFTENYQPTYIASSVDSITKYGQRMQYYDASMYTTFTDLKTFALNRLNKLAPSLMRLELTTSLGPESEGSHGFDPGYSFPAGNIAISKYGLNTKAWRAVEVETKVSTQKDGSLTTKFTLTPATGPSTGVNPAQYDSRRFW